MRDLTTLHASDVEGARERAERTRALLEILEGAGTLSLTVDDLQERWVQPQLQGSSPKLVGAAPSSSLAAAEIGATPTEIERCTKVLGGMALAGGMLAAEPSLATWKRVHGLLMFVSWTSFVDALAQRRGTPEANRWASMLATPPDNDEYVEGALADERAALREESREWRAKPRLLGRGSDHGRVFDDAYVTRLAVVGQLDSLAWFDALRVAPSRTELEFAITSAAQMPERLLDLLAAAPPAIDAAGNETGHVAAIILARQAWAYAEQVDGILESRTRIAWNAERREVAEADLRAFRDQEVAPWLHRVWAAMSSRADCDVLALALVVENVAQRTFIRDGRPPSQVAHLTHEHLENCTAVVWRPRMGRLANLLDSGDLGRDLGPLRRWLAFARIATDDVGDVVEGAGAAWARLAATLNGKVADRDLDLGPEHLSDHTWATAAVVLARQPDPNAAFASLFEDLWAEREQAYMGVRRSRHGSTFPTNADASRIALGAAARALTVNLPAVQACAPALWGSVFSGLRELWLRAEDPLQHDRWTVRWVFACGGAAHRAAVSGKPDEPGLRVELEEALSFLEPDPRLTVVVASSWLEVGWAPAEVLAFFGRAGIDLRAVCASEPRDWGGAHLEDLAKLVAEIGLAGGPNAPP